MIYALALAPYTRDYRWQAAGILLKDGRIADAKTMLEPLAYSPHAGDGAKSAGRVIAALEKGDQAAALKLYDEIEAKRKADEEEAKKKAAAKA